MSKTLITLCILFCISCGDSLESTMEYKPIEEFSNDTSLISNGDKISIFAFSGGKRDDQENVYYQQILGVNQKTGDTLSVICPVLKIPSDEATGDYTFISPLEFNPDRNVTEATYERLNDSLNLLIQTLSSALVMTSESNNEATLDLNKLKMHKKGIVVVNNRLIDFKRKHKTVIGILKFESDIR